MLECKVSFINKNRVQVADRSSSKVQYRPDAVLIPLHLRISGVPTNHLADVPAVAYIEGRH